MPTINNGKKWTEEELQWLIANYPNLGIKASAAILCRSYCSVRGKASELGVKFEMSPEYFQEWQSRAAKSKVGKKRPAQVDVIKRLHEAGKLKKTPDQLAAMSTRQKQWIRENGHPRGMLGKKHTQDVLKVIGDKARDAWSSYSEDKKADILLRSAKTRVAKGVKINPHGSWKAGWRVVGGNRIYFRSRWEANYGRYLEWLKSIGNILEWEHEPETFWFKNIRRGCVSYLPDFRIKNPNGSVEYHEVKGWMDDRSKTKIKRMAKYYPDVRLVVIEASAYRKLAKQISKSIEGWE